MKKLTREQILMLHAQLINQTGGSNGVRDYSLLESAVVNGRFCPQSVRSFCPVVAGFNAGTYKVPACVL